MSVFVDEEHNKFTKYYGLTIMSKIKNISDFYPLYIMLSKFSEFKLIKHMNFNFFDIFSQTISYYNKFDTCSKVEDWCAENNYKYYPYKLLPNNILFDINNTVKKFYFNKFPNHFDFDKFSELKIQNNKVVLKFKMNTDVESNLKQIISDLNELYNVRRKLKKYVILGYLKKDISSYNLDKLQNSLKKLNNLIPSKIDLDYPKFYQYKNVDEFIDL